MNRSDIPQMAQYIGTGLSLGLFKQVEIVKWADDMIVKENDPERFLTEISLCELKNRNSLSEVIKEFLPPQNASFNVNQLLALIYKRFISGQISIDRTIRALSRLAEEGFLSEIERNTISNIDDDFEMTYGEVGKELFEGSFEPIQKDVEAFLLAYKDIPIPFSLP